MKYTILAGFITVLATALLGCPPYSWAQEAEIQTLREQVNSLQETVRQLQDTIQKMQQESAVGGQAPQAQAAPQQQPAASPLDEAIADLDVPTSAPAPQPQGQALLQRPPSRGPQLRLIDVSLDVLLFAGASSVHDESISTLQGGGHDPKTRGYTLGQAELSLSGVVDPYFTAEAHILSVVNPTSGETAFELEEAFLTTTGLPYGLQLEAGYFLTEFGIVNPQHPHVWDWLDMPVANARMFGGDGMRQAGFRASWLLDTPWFSQIHFGMQNANGITMGSFLGGELFHAHGGDAHGVDEHMEDEHGNDTGHDDEMHMTEENGHEDDHDGDMHMDDDNGHEDDHDDGVHADDPGEDDDHGDDMHMADDHEIEGGPGIGGRPIVAQDVRSLKDFVYLMRWENAFDLSDELTAVFGISSLLGPNASGPAGSTWLYGVDMKWRWTPANSFRGYPFVTWQTEYMRRRYEAAAASMDVTLEDGDTETVSFAADTLDDWGMYTQLLYGFRINWATGVRFEYANGRGLGYNHGGRDGDPFRDKRYRLSPLLSWRASEFTRIRLQYNYDHATHLEEAAHTMWLGFEWLYGAHPAHRF